MTCPEITYITHPSREQLEQYFKIRHISYREILGWQHFSGAEEEDDRHASFVLALCEERVVGGIRLVVHSRNSSKRLPLEEEDFLLPELFPELKLTDKNYCEAGRLTMMPLFQHNQAIVGLFRCLLGLGQAHGCHYLFAVSPLVQARHYRQIFHRLGATYEIQKIIVPDKPLYEGTPMNMAWLNLCVAPDYRSSLTSTDTAHTSQTVCKLNGPAAVTR